MAVLPRFLALLCVLKVVSSFPSGFWPEFIEDDSTSTNLLDSTFEDDITSTTEVSYNTARDGTDSVIDGNVEGETADKDITAATAGTTSTAQYSSSTTAAASLDAARDDGLDTTVDEEIADTIVETAETTLGVLDSSSTTVDSLTDLSTTTVSADITTESQNSTLPAPFEHPPPPKQPPSGKPTKNWADIFCDKVKQIFNFFGHKISDSVSFIQRLFHWLY